MKIKFSQGNAKLNKAIWTMSLPAGFTCFGADECLSYADKLTGKIKDGANCKVRCFSASEEALFPNVRDSRWYNFEILKSLKSEAEMVAVILDSLDEKAEICRPHVSGDFFNQKYFNAWMEVARQRPNTIFYAYTKSIPLWINAMSENRIPDNFKLNASLGGKFDNLIYKFGLKSVKIVFSVEEASNLGLEIDHDDSHAYLQDKPFALLLHGTQPSGSQAAEALKVLRKLKIGGYGKDKAERMKVSAQPMAV